MNVWILLQDKSSDVRKAAEACIAEILRVSGQETVSTLANSGTSADSLAIYLVHEHFVVCIIQVEKIVKDIHGPALALVLERLRPNGALQGILLGVWLFGFCSK